MGLIVSSWSLSLVLGVPIGAFIGQSLNWRWTFWIFAIMSLVVLLLVFLILLVIQAAIDADLLAREVIEDASRALALGLASWAGWRFWRRISLIARLYAIR